MLARDESRVLGARTIHDFNDGVRLAIDLTYDEAVPPVALELTTVQDSDFLGTTSFTRKVADRLSSLAEREGLGAWEVTVSEDGDLRGMETCVIELIRRGEDIDATQYSSDDLFRWEASGSTEEELGLRRGMTAAGVSEVKRSDLVKGVALHTCGATEGEFGGVLDLDRVVASPDYSPVGFWDADFGVVTVPMRALMLSRALAEGSQGAVDSERPPTR